MTDLYFESNMCSVSMQQLEEDKTLVFSRWPGESDHWLKVRLRFVRNEYKICKEFENWEDIILLFSQIWSAERGQGGKDVCTVATIRIGSEI